MRCIVLYMYGFDLETNAITVADVAGSTPISCSQFVRQAEDSERNRLEGDVLPEQHPTMTCDESMM